MIQIQFGWFRYDFAVNAFSTNVQQSVSRAIKTNSGGGGGGNCKTGFNIYNLLVIVFNGNDSDARLVN